MNDRFRAAVSSDGLLVWNCCWDRLQAWCRIPLFDLLSACPPPPPPVRHTLMCLRRCPALFQCAVSIRPRPAPVHLHVPIPVPRPSPTSRPCLTPLPHAPVVARPFPMSPSPRLRPTSLSLCPTSRPCLTSRRCHCLTSLSLSCLFGR